jgi:TseV toxin immunity protein TsiV
MEIDDFLWREDDKIVFTPCFEIVVTSASPLNEAAPGLIRFYEVFMTSFASRLTTYVTGTMTSWRKPTSKAFQMVSAWLSEPRNLANGKFGMVFHSGPSVTELMPPALRLVFNNGNSYIAAVLPHDFVAQNPKPALDFVSTAIGSVFALSAGWGGDAIAFNEKMGPLSPAPRQKLRAWLKRHPGLGNGDNFTIYQRALHGISNVSWLTLLGCELVERKGGREAIEAALAALSPDIVVHTLGKGVCIQAGPLPQIGDVNRGDELPLYHQVGRYLKDLRSTDPPWQLEGLLEDTEEWYARFDD